MAESLAARLQQDGHLEITGDRKAFVEALDQAITGSFRSKTS